MELIYITNDPDQALTAQSAGVEYLMVDLEENGKIARQGHLNTVISEHKPKDITRIRTVLEHSKLLVRVNPLFEGTLFELNDIIARGADRVMLPMFTNPEEVARFSDLVGGRIPITLLLETPQALARLPLIAAAGGFDDIHLGLNDLHLGLGLNFMFELLSGGLMDYAANILNESDIMFGIGGVARLGKGRLPAELILSEHQRLGSRRVILSRDFQEIFTAPNASETKVEEFSKHVNAIHNFYADPNKLQENHDSLVAITTTIVAKARNSAQTR